MEAEDNNPGQKGEERQRHRQARSGEGMGKKAECKGKNAV